MYCISANPSGNDYILLVVEGPCTLHVYFKQTTLLYAVVEVPLILGWTRHSPHLAAIRTSESSVSFVFVKE